MKKLCCTVCIGLPVLATMNCSPFAEPARQRSTAVPAASSTPLETTEQSSKKIEQDCEDEWRINQDSIMKGGMTEDSYVRQCSVKDDVPGIPPLKKPNAEPSSAPGGSPDR